VNQASASKCYVLSPEESIIVHSFGPVKGAPPAGTTWIDPFPHSVWLDISKYYITAFKTGSYPAIDVSQQDVLLPSLFSIYPFHHQEDAIYFWARPHPASATASGDSVGLPAGSTWTQVYISSVIRATYGFTFIRRTTFGRSCSPPLKARSTLLLVLTLSRSLSMREFLPSSFH
jgi:hypothetical protein